MRIPLASGIIGLEPVDQTIGGWLGTEVEGVSSNGTVEVDNSP